MDMPPTPPTRKRETSFGSTLGVDSKAHICATQMQRPVPNMGACMHPDPRPSRRVVTIDLDASTPLLEEEQDFNSPIAESEQHAALSIPTNLSSKLKPLCAVCHVVMAQPPSSVPPKTAPPKA